jgi:DNA-binding winged helix-turn-helix (wHTH) protein
VVMRFGAFALDTTRRELSRDGAAVHLTPKAFDLLALLAADAPRVITKTELHARLWSGTFVSEATLTGLIKEIRRALDDRDPGARLIRTAHRVGYGFCCEVHTGPRRSRPPWHWLVLPGRRVVLHQGENVVGRDPQSDVCFETPGVSRRHARIVIDGDDVRIEDLGSKNGTTVGETPATGAVGLRDGDRIAFGPVVSVYRTSSAGLSTETRCGTGRDPDRPATG